MSPLRVPTSCERCGATHGPWGTHAGAGATVYEMWVDETGLVESALTVDRHAGASEHTARQRFANQLHRFVAEEPEATLQQPTVIVHLEFDSHSWSGPGFGPLGAPHHLHRALGELIDLALLDLSPRP